MIDLIKVSLKAGNGGDGRVSFHRAKYVPKGGPDGGDGADGGSVYLVGSKELNTLSSFAGQKEFQAEHGEQGGNQKKYGAKGEDLYIKVPVGTIVWKLLEQTPLGEVELSDQGQITQRRLKSIRLEDIQKEKVCEVLEDGQVILVCKGGQGGRGNDRFKSSINTTPMSAEKGTAGEQMEVLFELKLLADLGLVGFPNAGKSTFLSLVTKANPRIANYPFTTLEPNLGVIQLESGKEVVVADIPGIIQGASAGKGLGTQFLRHIERCRALMYVLFLDEQIVFDDTKSQEEKAKVVLEQLLQLRKELEEYHLSLLELPSFVTVNKIDLYDEALRAEIVRELRKNKIDAVLWSGVTNQEIDKIKLKIQSILKL